MSKDEIILEALIQYKENNWESHEDKWQDTIDDLIDEYRWKVK